MNEEAKEKQVDNDSQPELVDSSCSDFIQIQKEVRSVAVEIPVAVFTAHRGYDWSKLPDFVSRDEADSLFEKVMSVKTTYCDGLLPYGNSFEGVLYEGKYAFVFRLMTSEKWDQAKRDSNYCACAFIPHEILKEVDIERFLKMEYFLMTSYNPASFLNYCDEDFRCPSDKESEKVVIDFKVGNCGDFDWRLIGSMLHWWGAANDKWFIARMISRGESKLVTEFGKWNERYFNDVPEEIKYVESSRRPLDANVNISASNGISLAESDTINSLKEDETKASSDEELIAVNRQIEGLRLTIKDKEHLYDSLKNSFDDLNSKIQTIREKLDNFQKLVRDLQSANKSLESHNKSLESQVRRARKQINYVVIALIICAICAILVVKLFFHG